VPPEAEAVNVIVWPALGEDGLKLKLAEKGCGPVTLIVCCELAVCCGEPLSLTVKTTVKVPGDE